MAAWPFLLGFALALLTPDAHAQTAGAQGDSLMATDSFLEAGNSYRAAWEETRDPGFLGKAARAYMKLGADGRAQALDAAALYTQQAMTIDQAKDAQATLAEVQAMPQPAPPPAPAPPPQVVVSPLPTASPPPLVGESDPKHAQELDALYLSDGSIVRGLITSRNDREVAVTQIGGAVLVIPVEQVLEVRRVPNPDYEPRVVDDATAPVKAESGFRFGAASGIALPLGDFNDAAQPSFEVAGRVGWEFVFDQVGFSPAARAEYIRWANDGNGTYDFLHVGADLRLAGHFERVIPYLSVCLGGDLNYVEADDVFDNDALADTKSGKGFGLDIGVGMDILLTRRAAIGFGARYHPGFTDVIDGAEANTSFAAFQAGFSIY